jgi:hypothetical protein
LNVALARLVDLKAALLAETRARGSARRRGVRRGGAGVAAKASRQRQRGAAQAALRRLGVHGNLRGEEK